jgi:hypothetical protein
MRRALALLPLLLVSGACTSSPSLCDIRAVDCRDSLFRSVLGARGEVWDAFSAPPPSEVISKDEYRRRLEAGSGGASQPTLWDHALVILEQLAPGVDPRQANIDDLVNSVAAFYSSGTGRVTVIDRGTSMSDPGDDLVMAHELTHAVQDRDHGLADVSRQMVSTDSVFAIESLIEGEAVLDSKLVLLEIQGQDPARAGWATYFDTMVTSSTTRFEAAASRFTSGLQLLVYPVGGRYTVHAWLQGGSTAVRALWQQPRFETLQVLDAGYGLTGTSEPLVCPTPTAPPGASSTSSDQLGAIAAYVIGAGRWSSNDTQVWNLTYAWRSDAIWVFGPPTGGSGLGMVVVWRTRWADDTSATFVAAALAATTNTHDWHVERVGREVTLAATDQPGLLDTYTGWSCAP